jgi:very-short-patch-repair endonuclease
LDYKIKGFAIGERTLKELVEDIEKYSDPVKKLIWDDLCLKFDYIDCSLMEIKSPIEQALYLAWKNSGNEFPLQRWAKQILHGESVVFESQHEVKIGAQKYYLDFLLAIWLPNDRTIHIAIECDGHDFHEKTKKQARYDKQRERALIKEGYTVIRFTGSEIYADPLKCADEIFEVAKNLINQFK